MAEALQLARQAEANGEVPVGAVVVHDGNQPRYWHGRTAGKGSAEILILGCVPGEWKDAEIRVAVGKRWSSLRRDLSIPRVDEPRGRVELGTIRVAPPPTK